MKTPSSVTIAENKKARFDYETIETYEAGIVLFGSEVKSVRAGSVNLRGSHISLASGRPQAFGIHISPYEHGKTNGGNFDPKRERSLLMKKKDILLLQSKTKERGLTLVPMRMYLKGSLVKVEVALVR